MKVALGQFAVSREWQDNADTCIHLMQQADAAGADVLVLPEGILARDIADPNIVLKSAQPLDGPFMAKVLEASRGSNLTTMACIHVPSGTGRVFNVLITVRDGAIISQYRKLHLYDAFSAKESTNVQPGEEIPGIIEIAGLKVGMMTCYDLRFPEMARRLAIDGADVIMLPAAWVRGLGKEAHWEVLVTARALENTCYVVAVGECGDRNIGASMVVDPLGVAIARAGEVPTLLFADIDPARIAHARSVLACPRQPAFRESGTNARRTAADRSRLTFENLRGTNHEHPNFTGRGRHRAGNFRTGPFPKSCGDDSSPEGQQRASGQAAGGNQDVEQVDLGQQRIISSLRNRHRHPHDDWAPAPT